MTTKKKPKSTPMTPSDAETLIAIRRLMLSTRDQYDCLVTWPTPIDPMAMVTLCNRVLKLIDPI